MHTYASHWARDQMMTKPTFCCNRDSCSCVHLGIQRRTSEGRDMSKCFHDPLSTALSRRLSNFGIFWFKRRDFTRTPTPANLAFARARLEVGFPTINLCWSPHLAPRFSTKCILIQSTFPLSIRHGLERPTVTGSTWHHKILTDRLQVLGMFQTKKQGFPVGQSRCLIQDAPRRCYDFTRY